MCVDIMYGMLTTWVFPWLQRYNILINLKT